MSYRTVLAPYLILAIAVSAAAQDVLYYKFDAGGGMKVINFSGHSGIAPWEGTIVQGGNSPNQTPWTQGKFGTALKGDSLGVEPKFYLDTGWPMGFTSAFTVALYIKLRKPAPSNGAGLIFRGPGTQTKFSAALSAHQKTFHISWVGESFQSVAEVYSLCYSRWVHVAVVADDVLKILTIYIDGKPEIPQRLERTPKASAGFGNFQLGTFSHEFSLDIDEFRFQFGAASAADVKKWATRNPAADGAYGKGCWPKGRPVLLDSNSDQHGPPAIGNGSYALELYGLPGSVYVLALGLNRLNFGALPLPLDLGFLDPALKGCGWETSADFVWLSGVIGTNGETVLSLPIPQHQSLIGVILYGQAVLYSSVLKRYMATNAFVISVGE